MSTFAFSPENIQPSDKSPASTCGSRLLAEWGSDVTSLDLDLFLRYTLTARLLEQMLAKAALPVRILEVGCHGHDVLTRLFDRDAVQVRRCDIERTTDAADFFVIPPQPPWPMESESYDAVVALEVLEHLPADRRQPLIAECLRIGRHGAIFTTPNGVPRVVEAELLADDAFQRRHGKPHPFLLEHREHGLATADEIAAILRDLDCPHAAFDSEPVDAWLPMLLLAENLKERGAPTIIQNRLNQLHFRGSVTGQGVPYRKIYVCAKSAEAQIAFSDALRSRDRQGAGRGDSRLSVLQHMAAAASEALLDMGREVDSHQAQVAALLEDHRADLAAVQENLAEANRQMLEYRQRFQVMYSYLQALFGSTAWRLMAPVRWLRQFLRPRGFDANALMPCQQLERDLEAVPGTWLATGKDPQFLVPCVLPEGLLRVRLRLVSEVRGFLELYTDNGTCSASDERLLRLPVDGVVDREFFIELPRPALALRLDPLNAPGRFRIEHFEVKPTTRFQVRRNVPILPAGTDETEKAVGQVSNLPDTSKLETCPTPDRRLNIVYVLRTMGLCGGVKVVLEHVSRLHARGHNVRIYYLDGGAEWFPRPVPAFAFAGVEALQRALADFRGIKVATWYETAPWVAESLRPGDRGYYLVQDIEESYCNTPEEAAAVLQTYTLGLKPISEGVWVRDQLRQRFGQEPVFVSIGLDHELFQPRVAARDPNCILTQARTWSGGAMAGKRLKGWDTAQRAIRRCRELNPRTALLTFSMEDRHEFPKEMPHVHLKSPSDQELAKLYSRAGVYLLASNHEGFGLTAAEAMACGCPVVATRAHGNEEFCIDGQTALVAAPGDFEALASKCVAVQTDPRLAAELGANGRCFIVEYTWDRVIDRLEQEFLSGTVGERGCVSAPSEAEPIHAETPVDASGGEYPDLGLEENAAADWSIVVPTIDNVDLVVQCISSCRRWLPAETTVQFIVVDDGSHGAVLAGLRQAARELGFELLLNHQNLGFSATVNHGLRHCRGRFIVLCNNDILFSQAWLKPLEKAFGEQPRLGIAGIRLLYPDGSIQHAGMDKVPGELSWVHSFCRRPGDDAQAVQSRDVWSVTGAFFAVRREVLRRLGGLSTGYSTAHEDLDYCLNAWAHGIGVHYCGNAAAYHLEGGTRGATPQEKRGRPLLWRQREEAGRVYFEKKWAHLRRIEHFEQVAWQRRALSDTSEKRAASTPGEVPQSHVAELSQSGR